MHCGEQTSDATRSCRRHESIFCLANKGNPVLVEIEFPGGQWRSATSPGGSSGRHLFGPGLDVPVFSPNTQYGGFKIYHEPSDSLSKKKHLAWLGNRNDREITYDWPDRSLVFFTEPVPASGRPDYTAALVDNRWLKVVDHKTRLSDFD